MAQPSGRLSLECSTNAHFPTCFPGPTVGQRHVSRNCAAQGARGAIHKKGAKGNWSSRGATHSGFTLVTHLILTPRKFLE